MRYATALGFVTLLGGCDVLTDVANGVKAPRAELNRVDLVHAPTTNQLLSSECTPLLGAGFCDSLGLPPQPPESKLVYSFDLVFDLSNPNPDLPIPLVEVLVGMNVFDLDNLGTACISFCDPDDEACVPARNAEGACEVDESEEVKGPEDLVPTVDDLLGLTEDVISGETDDNGDWRYIPGKGEIEGHIQFDLSAAIMLDLADVLLEEALNDFIDGRQVKVEVPYTTEGTVFFDVPQMGRHAVGFGPWDDAWVLQE